MIFECFVQSAVKFACCNTSIRPESTCSPEVFLTSMQGSGILLQLMYGSRTAEAISATDTMNQIRLAELFASTIAEHAGIVAASAVYSFGRVSGAIISHSQCYIAC